MAQEKQVIAAVRQHDLELVKKLISEGASVNEQDEQGWTALHWAAGSGDVAMVRLLLEHHGDMSAKGRDNRTPWMVARAAGRSEFLTQAEKAQEVWKDPRESRPYCKGFHLKDLCGFSQWPRDTVPADVAEFDSEQCMSTGSQTLNHNAILQRWLPSILLHAESRSRSSNWK